MKPGPNSQSILVTLQAIQNKPGAASEIAKSIGLARATVSTHIGRLRKDRRVYVGEWRASAFGPPVAIYHAGNCDDLPKPGAAQYQHMSVEEIRKQNQEIRANREARQREKEAAKAAKQEADDREERARRLAQVSQYIRRDELVAWLFGPAPSQAA